MRVKQRVRSDELVVKGKRVFMAVANRQWGSHQTMATHRHVAFTKGFHVRGNKSYKDVMKVEYMHGRDGLRKRVRWH